MKKVTAVISVKGEDQKGVVARFATFLAGHGVNIEDLQQHVVRGVFVMDMLVDLAGMTLSLDELITGLLELGREVEMETRVQLTADRRPKRVAVLVSKEPHCLQKLVEDREHGLIAGTLDCVLSNHEILRPEAEAAGIEFMGSPSNDKPAHMAWLKQTMEEREIDLVVLARYMQILTGDVVGAFRHRIINIHPSLLPHFPGPAPYRQAYEEGVRVSGSTAHFVTEDLDEGPIILQDVFHIAVGQDTPDDVRAKGLALEADLLSKAVQYFLNEQLLVVDDRVVFKPGLTRFQDGSEQANPG
ncbi:MAG: formyltetrahydrofolate deformylase [Phycisphaerae bacterium]|nr:formyltetrahydrofolate deformylase [Phycisphaerae bacterium]